MTLLSGNLWSLQQKHFNYPWRIEIWRRMRTYQGMLGYQSLVNLLLTWWLREISNLEKKSTLIMVLIIGNSLLRNILMIINSQKSHDINTTIFIVWFKVINCGFFYFVIPLIAEVNYNRRDKIIITILMFDFKQFFMV